MLFPMYSLEQHHLSCTTSPVNPKNVHCTPVLYEMLHTETIKLLKGSQQSHNKQLQRPICSWEQ